MKLVLTEKLTGPRRVVVGLATFLLAKSFRPYQPVVVGRRTLARGKRESGRRLEAILDVVADVGARSIKDLGCAEGFFVRRCAEEGLFAWGVEPDARRLALAEMSTAIDGVSGVGWINMFLDTDTIRDLPITDVTLSLSVLHHVAYAHGRQAVIEQLAARWHHQESRGFRDGPIRRGEIRVGVGTS